MIAALLAQLRAVFPAEVARQFPFGTIASSRCIMASKVGREVLAYFGIVAEAVAVDMVVGNAVWWAWVTAGMIDAMPDEAWSVATVEVKTPTTGFDGHVLLHLPAVPALLDLDFQQFARPKKGIIVEPTLLLPLDAQAAERFRPGGAPLLFTQPGTGVVIHLERTARTDWRRSPDWHTHHHRDLIGPIIRRLKAREE